MKIEDILTLDEIQTVKDHAQVDAPYSKVRQLFPRLDRFETAIFVEYYKKLKEENYVQLGSKDGPYYDTEDIDEIYPQYSWDKLSFAEKAWYRFREKNNFKK